MSAVTFGKRERLKFVAAGTLNDWEPIPGPAIYALTYKQDAIGRPKAHTVVYFGQTSGIANDLTTVRHELREWWHENSGNDGELFIFFHPMPGSSPFERTNVQHQLVMEYDPRGNE